MAKTIFALIGAGLVFVLGVSFLASASFGVYPKNPREWTAEMREERPEEFAKLSEKALKADLATIDDRVRDLRESAAKLKKRAETTRAQFDFGKKLAVDLLAAKKAGVYPVEILGTKYDEEQLTAQTRQLCGELKAHQRTLDAAKKALKKLETQKAALANYRVEVDGALDVLNVNLEVFKANKISTEGLALLGECAKVLDGASVCLNDPVVGIEELMKRSDVEGKESVDELDLKAFLDALNDDVAEAEAEAEVKIKAIASFPMSILEGRDEEDVK